MGGLQDVATVSELEAVTRDSPFTLVYFWAGWCEPCKQMDAVLEELANLHSSKGVRFLRVEAEEAFEISERCQVSVVPYIVMYQGQAVAEKVEGYNIPALHQTLKQLLASAPSPAAAPAAAPAAVREDPPPAAGDTGARIKQLLAGADILLFMKGSPEQPRCGFSRKVVDALQQTGLAFDHFDILGDECVRQELKAFSNWPTYPQLYVNGELLGGCDIVLEMQASGELKAAIREQLASKAGSEDVLHERLKALVSSAPVMLFMKGSPAQPRCGFSRKVADALQEASIRFSHFDILKDEEVRQGLKEFSKWPSYPQLYVKGELVGGCDIVLEMRDAGELKQTVEEMLSAAPPTSNGAGNGTGAAPDAAAGVETRIKGLLASAPVLLFMKGSPQEPRCGFSRKVADALADADVAFKHFDILQDDDIRQGLKKFSNWPTYPQLYVKSDLVGGCDIILELQQSGELRPTIQDMLQRA